MTEEQVQKIVCDTVMRISERAYGAMSERRSCAEFDAVQTAMNAISVAAWNVRFDLDNKQ